MMSARNRYGDVLAFEVEPKDGPFFCPACGAEVILKRGRKVIAHFAHVVRTNCAYAGESEEHKRTKMEIYEALIRTLGVTSVRMEYDLQDVQADVFCVIRGEKVAIEVQISKIERDEIDRRTDAYARKDISVLWMPLLSTKVLDYRYAPKDWERYLHELYHERVYYWEKGLILQPVEYEVYLLAPSLFAGERPSKQFVSPSRLVPVLIPDLAPIWRNRWGKYPRVKLWCEPWDKR